MYVTQINQEANFTGGSTDRGAGLYCPCLKYLRGDPETPLIIKTDNAQVLGLIFNGRKLRHGEPQGIHNVSWKGSI